MESGELEPRVRLSEVAANTRRRVSFLLKKPFVEQEEVYTLFKEFFKIYLKKPYEFTTDELKKEMHRIYIKGEIREQVDGLIEKLSLLEYTDTTFSQAEVKLLLEGIDTAVASLVGTHKEQTPGLVKFANWVFRKKEEKEEFTIKELPVVEQDDVLHVRFNTHLEAIYYALQRKKQRAAAKHYKQLVTEYEQLDGKLQHEFYHQIMEAYKAIHRNQ